MARRRRVRWDRILVVAIPLLLIIFLCTRCGGSDPHEDSSNPDSSLTDLSSQPDDQPAFAEDTFLVVLDPGHGDHDGGSTSADGVRLEKDDNLTLGLATRDALLKYPHVNVILTRSTDEYISLSERCRIANEAGADLFVSLHRNSAQDGQGVEVWIDKSKSEANSQMDKLLAEYIMELLEEVGISRNRGIRDGFRGEASGSDNDEESYYVNANTNMPSCLVELGFMTSDTDNHNFDTFLQDYAASIARAIVELGTDKGLYNSAGAN